MSNDGDRISTQADGKDLKPYNKPTLKKGPVLSNITAVAILSFPKVR